MAWNGASGNYYSALGLNVAQNDGSDYSKAASQTLAGAADTGHSVIQDTNLAFELGKQDINRFNTLLGEQGYIDKDGNIHNATGLYGLVNDYALKEEKNNEDIARAEAWNQQQIDFDKDIQATGTKSLDDFARYTKDKMWSVLTKGGTSPIASIGDNKDKAMYYLNNPAAAKAALDNKEISQNDYDRLYATSQSYEVASNITKLNELRYRQQKIDSGWLDDKYLMQQATTMKSAGLWNDRARSTQDIYYALKKEQALGRNQGELLDSQFFVEDYANRNKKMQDLLYKGLNPITQQQPNVTSNGSGTNVNNSSNPTQNVSSDIVQNKTPYNIPPSVLNLSGNANQSSIFDENGNLTDFGVLKESERLQLEQDVRNAEADYNTAVANRDFWDGVASVQYDIGNVASWVVDKALSAEGAMVGGVMIGSPLYNSIRKQGIIEAAGLTPEAMENIKRAANGDPKKIQEALDNIAKDIMKNKTKTEKILSKIKNAGIGTFKNINNNPIAKRNAILLGLYAAANFGYNMLPDDIRNDITFNDPKDQFKTFMEKWYEPHEGKPGFKDKDGNLKSEYIEDLSRLNLDAIDKESNAPMMNAVGLGRYKSALKMARAHQSMVEYDNAKKDEIELNKSGSVANNIADPVRLIRDSVNNYTRRYNELIRIYGSENNIPTNERQELTNLQKQIDTATVTAKINTSNIINQSVIASNPSLKNSKQSESPSFLANMVISIVDPKSEGDPKYYNLGDGITLSKPEKPTNNEKFIETSFNKKYKTDNLIFDDTDINVDDRLKLTVLLPFIKTLNFDNKNAQSFFDALCTDEVIGYELQKLQDSLSLKDGQSALDNSAFFSSKGFVTIDENIKKRIFDLQAKHKPQLLSGFYSDNEVSTKMLDKSSTSPNIRVWSDITGKKFTDENGKEIGLIQKSAKVYRMFQGPNASKLTQRDVMLILGQL